MVSAGDTSLVSRPFPDTADTYQNLPEKRQAPTDGASDDLEDHLAMSEPENTPKLRNRKPRSDTAKSLDSKVVETSTKATPKVTKGSSRTPKSASKRAKPNPYDPKTVVSSRRSPLTKDHVDLVSILTHPKAWSSLSEEQLSELFKSIPETAKQKLGTAERDPGTMSFLMPELLNASSVFKSDCERFQEDLREGYLEPAWLEKAAAAMEERMNGEFDDYKDGMFEEFWGQKAEPPNQQ